MLAKRLRVLGFGGMAEQDKPEKTRQGREKRARGKDMTCHRISFSRQKLEFVKTDSNLKLNLTTVNPYPEYPIN